MHKLYWRLLLQERGVLILGLSLAIITAFAGIALLAFSGWFISAAALAGLSAAAAHSFNFFTPGAIVRGLSIARTGGRYGERLANHEATFRLIAKLRTEIFDSLAQQQGVSALMNRHQSASQMLQDITNIEGIHLQAIVPVISAWLSAIGFLLVSALFVPAVALAATPILLVSLLLLPWLYARALLEPETALHISRSALWSRTSALFSSLRLLTLTQQLNSQGEQLRSEARAADQSELEALQRQQLMLLLAQLSGIALLGVTLWLALDAYIDGALPGAQVFMLLLLALGTNEVVAGANPALGHLMLGSRALTRHDTLTKLTSNHTDSRRFTEAEQPHIKIGQLNFSYSGTQAQVLDSLNLHLNQPGVYWLAGESGRGKTTLLRLLAGELSQESGQIEIGAASNQHIGYLPQKVQLLRSTLRHNLDLKGVYSDELLLRALSAVQLLEWCQELPAGLDTWIGKGEWEPSGGETKRLGLARLVLQQPNIILLDEPFAGMDLELQRSLMQELRLRWQDSLVIIVSHDLELKAPDEPMLEL